MHDGGRAGAANRQRDGPEEKDSAPGALASEIDDFHHLGPRKMPSSER